MDTEKPPLGIVILYNASDQLIKGEAQDCLADQGVIACARNVYQALQVTNLEVAILPIKTDVETVLASYSPDRWMIFNLSI